MGESKGFTKTDMERVALFQEMSYVTLGDGYKAAATSQFNTDAGKGKQMLAPALKERDATRAGYFTEFTRVMEGEAYSDPIRMRRLNRMKEAQKNLGKPFIPSNGDKKPSGAGSHYGTLSGKIEHFSGVKRQGLDYQHENKNFYTNPGKKGTGYGYADVTMNKYHQYKSDEYDRARETMKKDNDNHKKAMKGSAFRLNMHPRSFFDENPFKADRPVRSAPSKSTTKIDFKPFKPSSPAKLHGGMKAGTFDAYPENFGGPASLGVKHPKNVVNNSGKTFTPNRFPKSAPQVSIVNHNVHKYVNPINSRTIQNVMCY